MLNPALVPDLAGITLSLAERQMGPINGGPINLAGAELSHASLRFASLSEAILKGANLSHADLSDTRLDGANLAGADLREAVLDRADFAGANLTGAKLGGASLVEARNLTQDQIETAVGNGFTQLPADLFTPRTWTEQVSQVALGPRPERAKVSSPFRPPAAISWLVGRPRSLLQPVPAVAARDDDA